MTRPNDLREFRFRNERVRLAIKNIARRDSDEGNIRPYISAAERLCASLPYAISIDNLLDAHNGNTELEWCGKVGIVASILDAERSSKLFVRDGDMADRSLSGTWYSSLFRLLSEGVSRDNVESIFNNVNFIIFNYDRCVEEYLYRALQTYYQMNIKDAATIMAQLNLIYPYGNVGGHPWRVFADQPANAVEFGSQNCSLDQCAAGIRTFCESVEEEDEVEAAKGALVNADKIVFLGFAYHRQNIDLIKPESNRFSRSIFGTAFGISDSNREKISRNFANWISATDYHTMAMIMEHIHLRNDLRCQELFHEYQLSLAG